MSFGASTITFRHFQKSGVPDELGNYTLTAVNTNAPGCRHRPLTFSETAEFEFDIATEHWRSTLPLKDYDQGLLDVIMHFPANDVIVVDGLTYRIIGGVRPHPDRFGRPYKATIISQKQTG